MRINPHYLNLEDSYLFARVNQKVSEYKSLHPKCEIIRLGIGDVTLPLVPEVIRAMQDAVAEMGEAATFRGYGEEQGYTFLRAAICKYYLTKGVSLLDNEVFISDGAKSDLSNILDIFAIDNTVLIPNPSYPVYVDTNAMTGHNIWYVVGNEENGFLPMPDQQVHADIIYLCSPNNPTGVVYNKEQLKVWVDYALTHDAVIFFDSAYELFVQDEKLPSSIYQIDGAKGCAIEFCSFSKMAGFTGTRCGYTVVPQELMSNGVRLNELWLRRQTTKFNGVSYIVQRGAEAVFTAAGFAKIKIDIEYYMHNARLITETLTELGIWFTGGTNSPYIWLKCPGGQSSWQFFDYLLTQANIVGTPGVGFGSMGEGYFRLTAFGSRENMQTAMQRLHQL